MSCMCGDPYCPSCGPAQGHDPTEELIIDFVAAKLKGDDDISTVDDYVELAAKIVSAVEAQAPQAVADELEAQAKAWQREAKRQRYFTGYGGVGQVPKSTEKRS